MASNTTPTDAAKRTQNDLAKYFKSLHVPGSPLVLANVWDALSASSVAPLPSTMALATASYAVAASSGIEDADLTLPDNLRAISAIAKVAAAHNKPLTADIQDGYGSQLQESITKLVQLGVVGCNLEDLSHETETLYDVDEAVSRIETALRIAASLGVPDFVVNARTDALVVGLDINEVIARGKRYLAAGATTVFIWGGRGRGTRTAEVEKAVGELEGRLNVSLVRIMKGGLSVGELSKIGVARISVGPQLMMRTVGKVAEEAERIYKGEAVDEDLLL